MNAEHAYDICKSLLPMADPRDPATLAKVRGWLAESTADLDYYHTHKDSGAQVTFGVGYARSCRSQIKRYGTWVRAAEKLSQRV